MSTRNAQHQPRVNLNREENNPRPAIGRHHLTCIGKGRYNNRREAEEMVRAYQAIGVWKRAYGCQDCKGYHLSSKERKS
jgi:hypothetical protein